MHVSSSDPGSPEQIDWNELQRRTTGSPFTEVFLTLADRLGIVPRTSESVSL
jgi:hypothetical protein